MPKQPLTEVRGFPKIVIFFWGGPYNKDYSILGQILGHPNFGKLPYFSRVQPVFPRLVLMKPRPPVLGNQVEG